MTEAESYYVVVGQKIKDAEQSQMFGKPCFKVGGKAFISFFDNEMVFKLTGEMHKEALSLDNAVLFDPSKKGRAMKEWVQLPFSQKKHWEKFAKAAYKYVSTL